MASRRAALDTKLADMSLSQVVDALEDRRRMKPRDRTVAWACGTACLALILAILFQPEMVQWSILAGVGCAATLMFALAAVAARQHLRHWPEVALVIAGFVALIGVGITARTAHSNATWERAVETQKSLRYFNTEMKPMHYRVRQNLAETFGVEYGAYLPADAAALIAAPKDRHCEDLRHAISTILNDLERGAVAVEHRLFDEATQTGSMDGAILNTYMTYREYARAARSDRERSVAATDQVRGGHRAPEA